MEAFELLTSNMSSVVRVAGLNFVVLKLIKRHLKVTCDSLSRTFLIIQHWL